MLFIAFESVLDRIIPVFREPRIVLVGNTKFELISRSVEIAEELSCNCPVIASPAVFEDPKLILCSGLLVLGRLVLASLLV